MDVWEGSGNVSGSERKCRQYKWMCENEKGQAMQLVVQVAYNRSNPRSGMSFQGRSGDYWTYGTRNRWVNLPLRRFPNHRGLISWKIPSKCMGGYPYDELETTISNQPFLIFFRQKRRPSLIGASPKNNFAKHRHFAVVRPLV